MAYKPLKLPDSERVKCNSCLSDLQALQEDIQKAEGAKIPGMDGLLNRCIECQEKVQAIKSTYFPNKR